MRKIIAVLLTVLMLASVLAALPASAAAATTYDGTTATTAGLNKIFISEIGRYMNYDKANKNAMSFVELYNNGDADLNLVNISLLLGVQMEELPSAIADIMYTQSKKIDGQDRFLWSEWRDAYRFISKMDLKPGKIMEDAEALKYKDQEKNALFTDSDPSTPDVIDGDATFDKLTNAGIDMTFSSGDNVAIWLITQETIKWMKWAIADEVDELGNKTGNKNINDFDPRKEFVIKYYGSEAAANYQDYKIIMVAAWSDYTAGDAVADDMFTFDNIPGYNDDSKNFILGVADSTWNINVDQACTPAVGGATTASLNEKLYSMAVMGTRIPKYTGTQVTDVSTVLVPANTVPYVANAYEKFMNANAVDVADYFAAGYVESYREAAVINWTDVKPTPGKMPDWQWAILNPDHAKAPETLKTEGAKDATKVNAAIDAYVLSFGYNDDTANAGRDESNITHNYDFVDQDELRDRFTKKKDTNNKKKDSSPVVLIIIIVAAVLVVAGGACAVVFLVILPKKKKAAAAAANASAEDTPAAEEDTPAQE